MNRILLFYGSETKFSSWGRASREEAVLAGRIIRNPASADVAWETVEPPAGWAAGPPATTGSHRPCLKIFINKICWVYSDQGILS